MKKLSLFLIVMFCFCMTVSVFAAPLFPDVPNEHWARDAVANLAAKGVLEGYPDGTFKGERAATRWEMAMAIQRLLAKMEAEHATFATKADLEALRALVNNLKDELDALGVRVKNLEGNVSDLDKRVTEKERITFEGDMVAKFVSIGIRNTGITGTPFWAPFVGGTGVFINSVDPTVPPNYYYHKIGTADLISGRPFINGAGFTNRARLGIKIKLSKDMSAAIRLASFTSAGNPYVDAYWGVNAPYLSNTFAGNGYVTGQAINNQPWTKMTFDSFILEHHPSKTSLTVGAINEVDVDNFILSRVPNPNIQGQSISKFAEQVVSSTKKREVSAMKYKEDEDTYIPFYGIRVRSKAHVITNMTYEFLYSKMPHGDTIGTGTGFSGITQPQLFSINGTWDLKGHGYFKLNALEIFENNLAGGVSAFTPDHGNFWAWSDPNSYAGQAASAQPMRSSSGTTFISQQKQTSWGASVNYVFTPSNIRAVLGYGNTAYKPNILSGYTVNGNHFRAGVGWTNEKNTLDLDAEYVSTDPYYDPFQLYYQGIGTLILGGLPTTQGGVITAMPLPAFYAGAPGSYIPFGYQLHDSGLYTNNRTGLKFGAEYRLPEQRGRVNLRFASLQEHTASTQQVDTSGGLNGMKPGFIEPLFMILSHNNQGTGAPGAFNPEAPKGKTTQFGGGVEYKFDPMPLKVSAQYDGYQFRRDSIYNGTLNLIGLTNQCNLKYNIFRLGLDYKTCDKFNLRGNLDLATLRGYHWAFNIPYVSAGAPKTAGSDAVGVSQIMPGVGFDYDIAKNTQWTMDLKYINTTDYMNDLISPQNYSGIQMMTQFKIKF